ncbi:hypothetical protein ILUMI_14082 [Ignelater luminosus]|uniref:Uncharacterized protein n=1 Tax=Ignelater luminosus TaxID=2038154 RepID=A0A8K0CVI4_IGNLU|nr:hypothetical protein ILUMI_14082 [Ignelater luminosus]
MNQDEFYLTLLSNSSMNYFPDNKTTKFSTQLPKRIRLTGQWVVGIAEIQYPCSILSVSDTDNLIYYRVQYHDEYCKEDYIEKMLKNAGNCFKENETCMVYNDKRAWYVFRISAGDYENILSIIQVINQHEVIKKLLNFEYNKTTKRVSLNMKDEVAFLGLSQRLCIQLRYEPRINMAKYPRPLHPANIWIGLPSQMFVYVDIVEPQFVGDVLSQLLRIINITSDTYNYSSHKCVIFSHTHYVPVMRKEFEIWKWI